MPSTRGKLIASLASVAVIAGAGSYGTFAAFTDTTSVSGNTFSAGTLEIGNSGVVGSAFALTNQRPGDTTGTKCIKVANTGTLDFADFDFYATVGGTGLADFLVVDVDRGTGTSDTGGSGFSCTGFTETAAGVVTGLLKDFPGSAAAPVAGETPLAAGASRAYRVTVTLPGALTDAAAEGKNASLTLHWAATS